MKKKSNIDRDWLKVAKDELKGKDPTSLEKRVDGVSIKPFYTQDDLEGLDHLGNIPGTVPYTRGVKATMYSNRPWTIRQYAGFSTAEESNSFYRAGLASGQRGLSVAFDLATHRGYDSDHPDVIGDVGKAGVAIDSVEDMKILFNGIPLDEMSVSMTMNGAVIPVLANFIVAGEEQGIEVSKLSGTIQNDILKEFMVRNTYIYPPDASMRIVSDIIRYTTQNMPRYNSVSISGYHIQEAGATIVQELAFTLADGREYVRAALKAGMNIDEFASRLSFFFNIGMNFFTESAKLRAARFLWARIMKDFGASERSQMLRTHCQTSGVSLQQQDPYNNIIRTAYEAMSAALGGTQSLHTNSFDEAIALPTDFSSRIARNTQLILQHETGITDVVDPLAGSYYVEHLTGELITEAWSLMEEIESIGGMTKAINDGMPKAQIEQAAVEKQSGIDRGEDIIVGVNKYALPQEENIEVRDIDNKAVRTSQMARLDKIRRTRDKTEYENAIANLKKAASSDGNLLEAAIIASRARASVGEISLAMESVFGRHIADIATVEGIYGKTSKDDKTFIEAQSSLKSLSSQLGRKPRILIVKLGQDGHDRGAKTIASAFNDLEFDVHVSPLFATPDKAAELALEQDVDVVGISSHTAGHKTLAPLMIEALAERGGGDKIVICGGVIPQKDYEFLYQSGIAAIFGPGTNIAKAALDLARLVKEQIRGRNTPT